jgi:hypothetical protein
MAREVNIDKGFFPGHDFGILLIVYTADSTEEDIADDTAERENVNGWTGELAIHVKPHTPAKLTKDLTVINGDAGELFAQLAAADSDGWEAGNLRYVGRRTGAGTRTVQVYGRIIAHEFPAP